MCCIKSTLMATLSSISGKIFKMFNVSLSGIDYGKALLNHDPDVVETGKGKVIESGGIMSKGRKKMVDTRMMTALS